MPVHVLALEAFRRDLSFRAALARERLDAGTEPLDEMARRQGAFAAVSIGRAESGFAVSGLTVIDSKVHFAPDPPVRPSIVLGRANEIRIGRFGPAPDLPFRVRQAASGLWTADEPGAEAAAAAAWTAICRDRAGVMYWIYAPDGGPLDSASSRLGCLRVLVAAVGGSASLVVDGVSPASRGGVRLPAARASSALLLK
jgi:hypothetical protein